VSKIVFSAQKKFGRFLDPRQDFEPAEVESELRVDPLTGNTARICHFSLDRLPPFDPAELVAKSAETCPFCGDKLFQITPRFPADVIPEGRLEEGQAVLFPNLFPYDDISAVAVIAREHFHPMADIPAPVIEDGVKIARAFFRRIEPTLPADGEPSYALATWNYMPPSGGSQVHPHMQVLHTTAPGNARRRERAAEMAYAEANGRPYWSDLIAAERKDGARWIGEMGGVHWLAPFAPTGMLGDAMAVFPDRASVTDLTDAEIAAFAKGLRLVLKGFADYGFWSFNLMFSGAPAGDDASASWLTARLVPRFYVNPALHVSDVAYLPLLLEDKMAMVYPEVTAERLRAAW
jgi:UDPglucose--hexose-1-phosphate uridylyltransferase